MHHIYFSSFYNLIFDFRIVPSVWFLFSILSLWCVPQRYNCNIVGSGLKYGKYHNPNPLWCVLEWLCIKK